ncbi:MAG: hypothetical protein AB8G05_12270 [Oligoflexales bacterium]
MLKSLDLVASENKQSPLVRALHLSSYGEKYYLSNEIFEDKKDSPYPVDEFFPKLLIAGNKLIAGLFNANWCDPRPLSGTHAMNCLLAGFGDFGDNITITPEVNSGHFATSYMATRLGLNSSFSLYDKEKYTIDPIKTAEVINTNKPSIVTLDASHVLFPHPLKELKSYLNYNPLIAYDASHTMGLIVHKIFQDPFEDGADIIHGGTHKTFPGPQKAIFLGKNEEIRQRVDGVIFPRFSSNFHLHHIISLYGAALEALVFGKSYANQVIKNAQHLGKCMHEAGLPVMAEDHGFTKSHQLWLNISADKVPLLNEMGIRATVFVIPGTDGQQKGIRLGTQAITRMGFQEKDMQAVAGFIKQGLMDNKNSKLLRNEVSDFVKKFEGISFAFKDIKAIVDAHPVGGLLAEHMEEGGLDKIFQHLVCAPTFSNQN